MNSSWFRTHFKRLADQDPFDAVSGFYFLSMTVFAMGTLLIGLTLFVQHKWRQRNPKRTGLCSRTQACLQACLHAFASTIPLDTLAKDHDKDRQEYEDLQREFEDD